ncbi:MAG: divergent PAP2 family protein [Candidatus Kerfeldbacteria bacterium]|nr:divergent PAP2 family protein [Candidatus Kerfeldbacteria bacterium]
MFQHYQLIFIPLVSLIITQAIKVIIDVIHHRPSSMNSYGGMPSTHSALFASLVMMAWYTEGLASYAFAISLFLYLTIIRDAAGIRQHLGRHGQMLKDLLVEHAKDHHHNIAHDKIVTRLGHTPWQIVVGSICGVVFTSIQYWFLH